MITNIQTKQIKRLYACVRERKRAKDRDKNYIICSPYFYNNNNKNNSSKIRKSPLQSAVDPFVFVHEILDDLLHGQIGNELIYGELLTRDRIEATDAIQVLLDVVAIVGDARGRNDGLLHQLEADLAAQVVGYFAFAATRVVLVEETIELVHFALEVGVYVAEELFLFEFERVGRRCGRRCRGGGGRRGARDRVQVAIATRIGGGGGCHAGIVAAASVGEHFLDLLLLVFGDEARQVALQLDVLLDALVLEATPASPLGIAYGARDLVAVVLVRVLGELVGALQIEDALVERAQLAQRLAEKEVRLDRVRVELDRSPTVVHRLGPLLQLQIAQRSIHVVDGHGVLLERLRVQVDGLLVVALHEQLVALLLELGRRGRRRRRHFMHSFAIFTAVVVVVVVVVILCAVAGAALAYECGRKANWRRKRRF